MNSAMGSPDASPDGDWLVNHRADYRTVAFLALHFALLVAALRAPLSAWTALYVVVLCYTSFTAAVAGHNSLHSPVFRYRFPERLLRFAITCAYGHAATMFIPGHNLSHHAHLQTRRDVIRTTKLRYRLNILNPLLFTPTIGGTVTRDNFRFWFRSYRRDPTFFWIVLSEFGVLVLFTLPILVYSPVKFLLLVMIPNFYAAWGILGVNFIQHDGCDTDHPYNHSRNFVSPFLNWFLLNNGFHGIHHMHPGLHWSQLPAAHARELHGRIHPELEQKSMFRYLWRSFVWPARRLRYDGEPVVLEEAGEDEDWVDAEPGSAGLHAA